MGPVDQRRVDGEVNGAERLERPSKRIKLHGRAFYESIGSPKLVLAPMVEQSEFAWRMLTRSFLPPAKRSSLLAYSPMFHSKMFAEMPKYRDAHFQPLKTALPSPPETYDTSRASDADRHLDGNPAFDRPLTVQFCSNDPDDLLNAAKHVAPFCDAVDLNLGCPQGIAKRGGYGAFLQEDWGLIASMVRKLHEELDVPVTAKMRVLETKEKTLEYARTIVEAGASAITVHGRRREQKGHNTGLADWSFIRYLRENLPKETVIFANGNILQSEDITQCLEETGADGVMSAEGNLYDPTIFADPPPLGQEGREYWRGKDGKGGYRVDAVFRRYMDIIHKYALGQDPPSRPPLFLSSDPVDPEVAEQPRQEEPKKVEEPDGPPRKKQKQRHTLAEDKRQQTVKNPNLTAMQAHLFHLLRPLVSQHHHVRDALARCRVGDIEGYEHVLRLTEEVVRDGIRAHEAQEQSPEQSGHGDANGEGAEPVEEQGEKEGEVDPYTSSLATVQRCKRPWWVCQPYVRPLPREAVEKGSMTLSKKEKRRLEEEKAAAARKGEVKAVEVGLDGGGRVEKERMEKGEGADEKLEVEVPRDGVVCG